MGDNEYEPISSREACKMGQLIMIPPQRDAPQEDTTRLKENVRCLFIVDTPKH